MDFTVYSDFTAPQCFALNEQLVELGVGTLDWRGVQLEPGLPVPMKLLGRRTLALLEDEVAEVRLRAGDFEIGQPRGKPNTARAILAVASVVRMHPAKAAAFRNALFRAYWRHGADLSLAGEVQRVADETGVPRFVALDHPDAVGVVERWELEWETERLGGVPRVVRGDGKILWGLRSREEVAAFFGVA